jgi:hypothetical protein
LVDPAVPQTKLAAAKAQRRQASLRRWMRELKTVARAAKFAKADKRVNRAQKKLVARLRASVRANQKAQKAVRRFARLRKAVLKVRACVCVLRLWCLIAARPLPPLRQNKKWLFRVRDR